MYNRCNTIYTMIQGDEEITTHNDKVVIYTINYVGGCPSCVMTLSTRKSITEVEMTGVVLAVEDMMDINQPNPDDIIDAFLNDDQLELEEDSSLNQNCLDFALEYINITERFYNPHRTHHRR